MYNATQEGLSEGIPSRFIYQLEHFCLPKHHFVKKQLHANLITFPKKEREVAKSPQLLDRLQKIAAEGFSIFTVPLSKGPAAFMKNAFWDSTHSFIRIYGFS